MCYKGGKENRCFIHKMGTKAAIAMAIYMTDLPESHVSQTAKELKKEGKGLPTPNKEEVEAFTRSQQFMSRHDPAIPDSERKTMERRWGAAREEKPDGATYYSWTRTPVESVVRWSKKWKRTAMAGMAAGSIVVMSACGSTPPDNNQPPISTPTSVTQTVAPTESPAPTVKPSETAPSASMTPLQKKQAEGLEKAGLEVSGQKQTNKDGSYTQVTVKKNSDLATFDASKHTTKALPSGWSKKDASDAQEFASNFLMKNVIDSPSRGDGAKVVENAEKASPNFSKDYRKELTDIAKSDQSFLLYRTWSENDPEWSDKGYKLKQDGGSRILDSNIKVVKSQNWSNGAYFTYSGSYNLIGTLGKNDYSEKHYVHYGFTVVKEGKGFKISGIEPSIYPDGVKTSTSPVGTPTKITK